MIDNIKKYEVKADIKKFIELNQPTFSHLHQCHRRFTTRNHEILNKKFDFKNLILIPLLKVDERLEFEPS